MSFRTIPLLSSLFFALCAGVSSSGEPAHSPAQEWMEGEQAAARIEASEGVVFVDLYAHY